MALSNHSTLSYLDQALSASYEVACLCTWVWLSLDSSVGHVHFDATLPTCSTSSLVPRLFGVPKEPGYEASSTSLCSSCMGMSHACSKTVNTISHHALLFLLC